MSNREWKRYGSEPTCTMFCGSIRKGVLRRVLAMRRLKDLRQDMNGYSNFKKKADARKKVIDEAGGLEVETGGGQAGEIERERGE